MSFKSFILATLLLAAGTIGATSPTIPTPPNAIPQYDGGSCNLPAPFYVQVDEVGTSWIKLSWGGNTSYKHRIRTYRASDNSLLNTKTVAAGTLNATIDSLPSGTEVYSIVNAICNDGLNSPFGTTSPTVVTMIIDVLIQAFTPDQNDGGCSFAGISSSCTFSDNGTTFKIYRTSNASDFRYFRIKHGVGFNYKAEVQDSNSRDNSSFDFLCADSSVPNCSGPTNIYIWDVSGSAASLIGWFHTGVGPQTGTFYFTKDSLATTDFTIQKMKPARSSEEFSDNSHSFAAPNPFSNSLDLFIGNKDAEKIHLQMFDLSGRVVLDRQFTGGQKQFTLPTENLSNGFYFVRLETDGVVETLKVVKSE